MKTKISDQIDQIKYLWGFWDIKVIKMQKCVCTLFFLYIYIYKYKLFLSVLKDKEILFKQKREKVRSIVENNS